MSSLDNLNLPPVIGAAVSSISSALLPADPSGQVIVAYSVDLKEGDLSLLKEHGKVLMWDDHLVNIPFANLTFDYLLMDIRQKAARAEISRQSLSEFSVCAYVSWVQMSEKFISQINAHPFTSFPVKSVSKADFDNQLLNEKIVSPSMVKSVFRFFLGCLQK